jgi:hypothetical protein
MYSKLAKNQVETFTVKVTLAVVCSTTIFIGLPHANFELGNYSHSGSTPLEIIRRVYNGLKLIESIDRRQSINGRVHENRRVSRWVTICAFQALLIVCTPQSKSLNFHGRFYILNSVNFVHILFYYCRSSAHCCCAACCGGKKNKAATVGTSYRLCTRAGRIPH